MEPTGQRASSRTRSVIDCRFSTSVWVNAGSSVNVLDWKSVKIARCRLAGGERHLLGEKEGEARECKLTVWQGGRPMEERMLLTMEALSPVSNVCCNVKLAYRINGRFWTLHRPNEQGKAIVYRYPCREGVGCSRFFHLFFLFLVVASGSNPICRHSTWQLDFEPAFFCLARPIENGSLNR